MTTQRYGRPPVAEAIIDMHVQLPDEVALPDLLRCHDRIGDAYPIKSDINEPAGQLAGFLFHSTDKATVFQARLTSFALHKLKPYDGWESFRHEAQRLWNIYREMARPIRIRRLALRYINLIGLPEPVTELKDFLRTGPDLSPDLPQMMSNFWLRVMVPVPEIESTLVLTEAIGERQAANRVPILLDIDLFRTDAVPFEEDRLWGVIEALHARKNAIFEACITDQTRELFR